LPNIRPGAPNNGIPTFPAIPISLPTGYIVEDSNGNIEQVAYGNQINGSGLTDAQAPTWPTTVGATVATTHLVWENLGPWKPGITAKTDPGTPPDLISGNCMAVTDIGQNNIWDGNSANVQSAVNGPSYMRGTFSIPFPGAISGNTCVMDLPDQYGNGQCWWGGDEFSNGGPPYMATNGLQVSASGGGTAWVGDYAVVSLDDATPQHYNNFQGMSQGTFFWVTSGNVANVIDPWGVTANGGAIYGHPSVRPCNGVPLIVSPGAFHEFHYDDTEQWMITQVDCPILAASTVNLVASSNPTVFGTPLNLMATVTGDGTIPTGTVVFSDDGNQIATISLAKGSANYSTSTLKVGQHIITASYSGDGSYAAGTSTLVETIQPAASISPSPIVVSPATLASGTVGTTYNQTISASGGNAPYQFVISSGALPPGLSLSAIGQLSGTPATTGSSTFTVTASDSSTVPSKGSATYTLIVYAPSNSPSALTITITPTSAVAMAVSPGGAVSFDFNVTPSSGTFPSPVGLSVTGLPPGATATINPSIIPVHSAGGPLSVSIQTSAASAFRSSEIKSALALLFMPFLGIGICRTRSRSSWIANQFSTIILMGLVLCGLMGCGVSGTIPSSIPYTIKITAISGDVTQSTTVTLTVN